MIGHLIIYSGSGEINDLSNASGYKSIDDPLIALRTIKDNATHDAICWLDRDVSFDFPIEIIQIAGSVVATNNIAGLLTSWANRVSIYRNGLTASLEIGNIGMRAAERLIIESFAELFGFDSLRTLFESSKKVARLKQRRLQIAACYLHRMQKRDVFAPFLVELSHSTNTASNNAL